VPCILAVIPLALLVDHTFIHPADYEQNSQGEFAYTIFGVPILIFNLWAWIHPEIIEFYFLGVMQKEQNS